jgi:long-subunit acyl-CoA synthetase (AMP-forming)
MQGGGDFEETCKGDEARKALKKEFEEIAKKNNVRAPCCTFAGL